jgi:3D (Asp-Asp-Asp) domain-containing protein
MTNKLLLPLLGILFFPLGQSFDVVATAYAPLDPAAVAGMCYSGDPRVTASGRRTEPGVTIAAPRTIPFGTWIHLEGVGWRRVDDRGGRIKGKRIDICMTTRKEALKWGMKKIRVFIPKM